MSKFKKAQQWLTFAHQWLLYDAKHQDVFDSATKISGILKGQYKPFFSRPDQFAGDHVIVINSKEVSLPNKEWRHRMYFHHTLYLRGASWASAYELHLRDPTIVLYKAIYNSIGGGKERRTLMARCHIFPDDNVPKHLMENVCDNIRQIQKVPKKLSEYSDEEIRNFPKLIDYPKDFVNKTFYNEK